MNRVHVLDTGCANLASMRVALAELGAEWVDMDSADEIGSAERVVLPGVGSFEAGMRTLDARGWTAPLRERVRAGRSTLAVCLGLQLLTRGSDECPGRAGLGVVDAEVRALSGVRPLPHMGWNSVRGEFGEADAYFANSYAIDANAVDGLRVGGWQVSVTRHGRDFVAMLARDRVVACQFHPELSGDFGRRILRDWWTRASTATGKGVSS